MLSARPGVFSRWRKSGGRQEAKSARGEEYTDVAAVNPDVVFRIPELLTTLDAIKSEYYLNNHGHCWSAYANREISGILASSTFLFFFVLH